MGKFAEHIEEFTNRTDIYTKTQMRRWMVDNDYSAEEIRDELANLDQLAAADDAEDLFPELDGPQEIIDSICPEISSVESLPPPLDMQDIVLNESPTYVKIDTPTSLTSSPNILSIDDLATPTPTPSPAHPPQQQIYDGFCIHGLRHYLTELMFGMSQLRASEGCQYIVKPLDGECFLVVG